MMTALATVVGVQDINTGFRIELSCEQQTSCRHCASSENCGTGIVSKAIGNKTLRWHLETLQPVRAGQIVEIGFPEKSLLQSAMLVYLLPLLMMIFGAGFGDLGLSSWIGGGELIVILSSVCFITLGVFIARYLAKKIESRSQNEVVLLRVLGEPIL